MYREITSSSISQPLGMFIQGDIIGFMNTNIVLDATPTTFLAFGKKYSENKVIEVYKSKSQQMEKATLPYIDLVNDVTQVSPDIILICGKSSTGEDMLIKYNISSFDTAWTRTYSSQAEMTKVVSDAAGVNAYSIGISSGDVVVRKIDTAVPLSMVLS